jgi:hypothetical protein
MLNKILKNSTKLKNNLIFAESVQVRCDVGVGDGGRRRRRRRWKHT